MEKKREESFMSIKIFLIVNTIEFIQNFVFLKNNFKFIGFKNNDYNLPGKQMYN